MARGKGVSQRDADMARAMGEVSRGRPDWKGAVEDFNWSADTPAAPTKSSGTGYEPTKRDIGIIERFLFGKKGW